MYGFASLYFETPVMHGLVPRKIQQRPKQASEGKGFQNERITTLGRRVRQADLDPTFGNQPPQALVGRQVSEPSGTGSQS